MDVVHVSRELEVAANTKFTELYKTYCCLQQLRYPLLLSEQFRSGEIKNPLEALMTLVDVLRHCDVRQAEDRIFAVAGLLRSLPGATDEAMRLLEADYDKPLTSVFRDATRSLLLISGSDVLLTKACHRDASELLDESKPSWSFYWDRPQDLVQETGRPTLAIRFHAGSQSGIGSLKSPLLICTDPNPNILCLRGFFLGKIENFVPCVRNGALHENFAITSNLIETVLPMVNKGMSASSCQVCEPDVSTLDEQHSLKVADDALRLREVERAHEVVRRRLSRKVGDMGIEAYANSKDASGGTDVEDQPHFGPGSGTRTRQFARDLTAVTVLSAGWFAPQFQDEHAVQAFQALLKHMRSHGTLPYVLSDAFNMYMTIAAGSNNRCFFTTKFGDVGCGPKIMDPDDVVAILLGAKYPFILRRTDPFDGTYRFVGTAIIPTLMHGKALSKGIAQQDIRLC